MNKIHSSVIGYIREAAAKDGNPLAKLLSAKTDEQMVRMMFQNFRGRDKAARGLRLTNFGVQVMKGYFQAYEIETPGDKIGSPELVYLDRRAKLPYHVGEDGNLVMFDPELGIKLKLADGDIRTLIEMDGYAIDR